MPIGKLLDGAKALLADEQLANYPFDDVKMGLSFLNATPDHDTNPATVLANECGFSGYSRQVVDNWQPAVLTADFHARAAADACTFNNTSGVTQGPIYLWFLYSDSAGVMLFVGRYDDPPSIVNGGSFITRPFYQRTNE